ncbi:unnamed protein product [Colias eurytheme]|nr:unnamed protein product [Colias eurytheme]
MNVLRRFQSATSQLKQIIKPYNINDVSKRNTHDAINLDIDGEHLKFPHVWLRDNCQCEQCFHTSARSRIIDYSNFNIDSKPKEVVKGANSVKITWDDGHTSNFKLDWLKLRSFTPESQNKYTDIIYRPKRTTWHGKEFFKICGKHDYNEIVTCDEALYKWLYDVSVYGVAFIQNTPNRENAIHKIIARVGFPKQTHYGIQFIVQNVANTSNVAYLSGNLQMHTDLPYYEYCPGVNMLHYLVQTKSEGGENLLSDCHYTAQYMKEHYSEEYKLLTNTEVEWSDIGVEDGNEFFKLYRSPVICLDTSNEVIRINFSIPQRGNHFPGSLDTVVPWYKAHKLFHDLNQKFAAKFKTNEGDILVFDNIRLLHGRNKYEDKPNNTRKLIGAYVDWDEMYSRLRCLKVKLSPNSGIL